MAAVTGRGEHPGPIPKGTLCDDCSRNLATQRMLAASDSFGSEFADLCDECAQKERQRREEDRAREDKCDWCGKMATNLHTTRDYDEGSAGPPSTRSANRATTVSRRHSSASWGSTAANTTANSSTIQPPSRRTPCPRQPTATPKSPHACPRDRSATTTTIARRSCASSSKRTATARPTLTCATSATACTRTTSTSMSWRAWSSRSTSPRSSATSTTRRSTSTSATAWPTRPTTPSHCFKREGVQFTRMLFPIQTGHITIIVLTHFKSIIDEMISILIKPQC